MQAPSTMRVTVSPCLFCLMMCLPLRPRSRNCQSSAVSVAAAFSTRSTSSSPVKWAPYEQHPCSSSGAGPVSTPWHPRPKMHVQLLARNVTSNTHVRSSSGSSKLTHSWAVVYPSGGPELRLAIQALEGAQLVQELACGQQALPELVHVHLLVGGVGAVVGQGDPEVQHRRVEHAAQRLFGSAPALPREQRGHVPHPFDGALQRSHCGVVDGREGGGDAA